jgi:hypothetical protein
VAPPRREARGLAGGGVAVTWAGVLSTLAASVLGAPTPSATPQPGGSGGHGAAFYVLGTVLVVALLISVWRLRRRTSGPEN